MTQTRREVKVRAEAPGPKSPACPQGSDRTGSGDFHRNLKIVLRNERDEMVSATWARPEGGVSRKVRT